ncbi:unnamed protein product [Hyaloperonospora brassicae]|uniref:PDZ domain-containing protein n=1 Tax=Hyaloperonospora brassicae TaxID=162125 RepID=A0AAV0UMK3_HYABA|nr:unnamed protein product [Hyaloperonospora brassicae]
MSKCRLGDQLLKINNESVTSWPFAEIVETLEIARRPISLTFRTTANVHTSPRASTPSLSSTPSLASTSLSSMSSTSSTSSMHFSSSLLHRKAKSTSEMEPEDGARSKVSMHALFSRSRSSKATHRWKKDQRLQDGGDVVDNGREGYDSVRSTCDGVDDRHDHSSVVTDRRRDTDQHPYQTLSSCYDSRGRETTTTTTSVRSSVLSEDVEMWCREQEEMHSDIIMLLTETVMRCERLQQENLDQLQSLMQLSVNSPSCRSDCSSAASSYAGGEKSGKGDKCLEFIDGDAAGPVAETSSTSSSPRA